MGLVVYYESIKRELKIRCMYIWVMVRWKTTTKTKEFTSLTYTGLVVELEHLKIETRLIDEKFVNAMGEYVTRWDAWFKHRRESRATKVEECVQRWSPSESIPNFRQPQTVRDFSAITGIWAPIDVEKNVCQRLADQDSSRRWVLICPNQLIGLKKRISLGYLPNGSD
jgi:hypothetical protein